MTDDGVMQIPFGPTGFGKRAARRLNETRFTR